MIFSIPFSFPIFPSMVLEQEWQVIPSMFSLRSAALLPVVWDGDEAGPFAIGLWCGGFSAGVNTATTSLSCCAEVREGTKETVMPSGAELSRTSNTPWHWESFSRASCRAAGVRPEVGISWVSVGTGEAALESDRLDSNPMSSIASDRDSGLCWLWSNMTVAFFCSKDTWKRKSQCELSD